MSEFVSTNDSIQMELSVIIVSWNTRDLLKQCLSSIYASDSGIGFEVWVVDNTSDDGSVAMLRSDYPEVNVIENDENVGFATANNQAIRASSGRFVLLLNPDTEVKTHAFDEMVRFMTYHDRVGAVGSRVQNPDGSLQLSCYPTPTLARETWRLFHLDRLKPYGSYDMCQWDTDTPREVETLMGSCLMLRRAALDQIGLLDEDYFMYTEEIDLCYRLGQAGWQLYWVPQAEIIHYGGQSTRQVEESMFLNLYGSKILFFRKHHGRVATQLYKLVLLLAATTRLLLSPLAVSTDPDERAQRKTVASHYKRLVSALPNM